ncbi:D-alanyl-D-alanine carboxypeptidase family protein [uncultured Limosilactobacillus sp.]|uniref:D-alanyl-D-alanine carboxypeptidase family protein n=1 Tax=uncultured Limosilactobacillus sp. TaxID=2837629 RepID=UPI0025D376C6|nr:serine hydrolase [uncultured Limosilactobacillus sp.]
MKKHLKQLVRLGLAVLMIVSCLTEALTMTGSADQTKLAAKAAITMDAQTGQILYQQNANQKLAVASCTKILTLAVIEQDIAQGKLSWNQKIKISKKVAKTSTDWHFSNVELKAGHSYTVKSLCESMMIVSADGSAEALALASAGSTAAFNKKMQAVAHKAGVNDANIYNMIGLSNGELGSNGLKGVPKKAENAFSAKDMALISRYLVNHYPDALNITKATNVEFKVDAKQSYKMQNINGMLPNNGNAPKNGTMDGLKTGSTDKAGNCFVGTGIFDNRRLITVVLGTDIHDYSKQFKETNKMLEAVQAAYQPEAVKQLSAFKGLPNQVRVTHGKRSKVPVSLSSGLALWLPKNSNVKNLHGELSLIPVKRTIGRHKLRAPLKKGETVGTVKTTPIQNLPSLNLPVVSQQNVGKKSLMH